MSKQVGVDTLVERGKGRAVSRQKIPVAAFDHLRELGGHRRLDTPLPEEYLMRNPLCECLKIFPTKLGTRLVGELLDFGRDDLHESVGVTVQRMTKLQH